MVKTPDNVKKLKTSGNPRRFPKPPSNLSKEAGSWWAELTKEYVIDDHAGLLLLQTALEAFDRMREAQALLSEDGLTVTDRYGQFRPHPAAGIERDQRGQMLAALKQLNLDIEPLGKLGRPITS